MQPSPEIPNPFSGGVIQGSNVPHSAYHKADVPKGKAEFVMTQSEAFDFAACPIKWLKGGPPKEATPAMRWGSLVDCLTLTPNDFNHQYVFPPKTYLSSKGVEAEWSLHSSTCRDWEDEQTAAGKTVISQELYNAALEAVARLREDDEIKTVLDNSVKQVMIRASYKDRDTGLTIPVKGLIDIVPNEDASGFNNCLADFKTSYLAAPSYWKRQVFTMGYHVQAAWYLWIWNSTGKIKRESFLHIISENTQPYIVGKRVLTEEYIRMGQSFIIGALAQYCRCLSTGKWPDYDYGQDGWRGWSFCAPEPWMLMAGPQFPVMETEQPDQPEEPSTCPT